MMIMMNLFIVFAYESNVLGGYTLLRNAEINHSHFPSLTLVSKFSRKLLSSGALPWLGDGSHFQGFPGTMRIFVASTVTLV